MRLTYISEGSKELGMGHIMHQSVVMDRLKWRSLESDGDILVVDALDPNAGYPRLVKPYDHDGGKIVVFNCLEVPAWANIAVTPDVSPDFQNIVTREGSTLHFAGPKYWFLRDEFLNGDTMRVPSHERRDVGILIGGTDPLGLTKRLEAELKGMNTFVIRGASVAFGMSLCKVMLTGCGQSFWESLAVGTPAIPFAANEAQAKQYGSVFELGAIETVRDMIRGERWVKPNPVYEIGRGWSDVVEAIVR